MEEVLAPSCHNLNVVTDLEIDQVNELMSYTTLEATPLEAPSVGLLFFTSVANGASGGFSLWTGQKMATKPFLIDTASQLSFLNAEDIRDVLPGFRSNDPTYPQGRFAGVSGAVQTAPVLPSGTVNLVLQHGTSDQVIVRTAWTVLEGAAKRGTPLVGTGVLHALRAQLFLGSFPDSPQVGGTLEYVIRADQPWKTARVELLYTAPQLLPYNASGRMTVDPASPSPASTPVWSSTTFDTSVPSSPSHAESTGRRIASPSEPPFSASLWDGLPPDDKARIRQEITVLLNALERQDDGSDASTHVSPTPESDRPPSLATLAALAAATPTSSTAKDRPPVAEQTGADQPIHSASNAAPHAAGAAGRSLNG